MIGKIGAKNTFRKNGEAVQIIGKSRSGKTALAQHLIRFRKYKRVLIWDFDGGWSTLFALLGIEFVIITNMVELTRTIKGNKSPGLYCYRPDGFGKANLFEEFDLFCGLAFLWIKWEPACIVVEEAAAVLQSGQARGNWNTLQNQGQKFGGSVFSIIQRPQEGDKTSMTQATDNYIFRVSENDKKYVANKYGVKFEQIPDLDLAFLHIDKKGDLYKGFIDFNGQPEQGADPYYFKLKTVKT